jgi:hypothetical protein
MDAATIRKQRKLSELLYKRTLAKGLSWTESSYLGGFQADVGDHVVNVRMKAGQYDEPDYVVTLLDPEFNVIESFSDSDLFREDEPPAVGEFRSYYSLLEDVYRMANRQSKGADKALDAILSTLELDDLI